MNNRNGRAPKDSRTLRLFVAYTLSVFALTACDSAPDMDLVTVGNGLVEASIEEAAETALVATHVAVMPVDAHLHRQQLNPGDTVTAGQTLARVDLRPLETRLSRAKAEVAAAEAAMTLNAFGEIERTLRIELIAAVDASETILRSGQARVDAEGKNAARARKELDRVQRLAATDSASQQALDDAAHAFDTAEIALREAELALSALRTLYTVVRVAPSYVDHWLARKAIERQSLQQQLNKAIATVSAVKLMLERAQMTAPHAGTVIERLHEGGAFARAGEPLIRVGDLSKLQVRAELLSEDALQVTPGMMVHLRAANQTLVGRVRLIEPYARTKISALGIEQQRAAVWIEPDIVAGINPLAALGLGYRVHARVVLKQAKEAVRIPRYSVLKDVDGSHFVLRFAGGALTKVAVELGIADDIQVEVLSGLRSGDRIARAPDASQVP